MNEIVPSKNKFNDALKKIEEASNENKKLPELKKFKEKDDFLSLFPKNVTGAEMNNFVTKIQENLVILNDKNNKIYKQLTDIYTALDALDKEYIAGIVGSFNEAIEAMKKAEDAQKDITKAIDVLYRTVETISESNNRTSLEFNNINGNIVKLQNELEKINKENTKNKKIINVLVVIAILSIILGIFAIIQYILQFF